jgi:hypothetical protein
MDEHVVKLGAFACFGTNQAQDRLCFIDRTVRARQRRIFAYATSIKEACGSIVPCSGIYLFARHDPFTILDSQRNSEVILATLAHTETEDPMCQQAVVLGINQIGTLMTDQPEKTKNSPATVQDLRNMGIGISLSGQIISQS